MDYQSPRWLPRDGWLSGAIQTIWPALFSRKFEGAHPPLFERERWITPDEDFIDVDFLKPALSAAQPDAPLLVLFHGLEGSSASHYATAFAHVASQRGWHYAVPNFRGCSGEINLAPRAYHSGDFEEIGWILQRFKSRHAGPVLAVGVSLGGNALLRWGQEAGASASKTADAIASICAPLDLMVCGWALGQGWNRQVFTRLFLRSLKARALKKWEQFPRLFDKEVMLRSRDLYEFDDVFTAPLHGYVNTYDYWSRASSKPHLHQLRLPTLIVNPVNDPFVPAASQPGPQEVSPEVTLYQPQHGGHIGFAYGSFPGHVLQLPEIVCQWLVSHQGSNDG